MIVSGVREGEVRRRETLGAKSSTAIPKERVPQRTGEHIADVPAPQRQEKLVEVIQPIQQARTSARSSEQFVDVPVPHILERVVKVEEAISEERLQQRTAGQKAVLASTSGASPPFLAREATGRSRRESTTRFCRD